MKRFSLFLVGYLCVLGSVLAQTKAMQAPRPYDMYSTPPPAALQPRSPQQMMLKQQRSQQAQNQRLIQQAQQREHERQSLKQKKIVEGIHYGLGPYIIWQRNLLYRDAANSIYQMLQGTHPFNLRKAVYKVENAYLDGDLSKTWFDSTIQNTILLLKVYCKKNKYALNTNTDKNLALVHLLTKGIHAKHPVTKQRITIPPYQYDFEDYIGEKDHTKMFVSKLLRTGSGNCHSLPLLYLLLAEELGAKAHLAYAPSHSYIMFQNEEGQWLNYETTNRFIISNQLLMSSGFVKAEAIKSGIFIQPVDQKELLVQCTMDLANAYEVKFGLDENCIGMVSRVQDYAPMNIYLVMHFSNYQTKLAMYVEKQLLLREDYSSTDDLPKYPIALNIFNEMMRLYDIIDERGYAPIPKEAYEAWLQDIQKAKAQQDE